MARDHARIQVGIWTDPDFRALTPLAQRMYLLLVSQPRLSFCGSLDYIPSRIALLSATDDDLSVEHDVRLLEADRYVIVDRESHELLIRTYVRHDGLLASPNVTKAMVRDRRLLLSDCLRGVVDEELGKAYDTDPKLAGWKGLKDEDELLFRKVSGKGSANPFGKGSGKGSERGSA